MFLYSYFLICFSCKTIRRDNIITKLETRPILYSVKTFHTFFCTYPFTRACTHKYTYHQFLKSFSVSSCLLIYFFIYLVDAFSIFRIHHSSSFFNIYLSLANFSFILFSNFYTMSKCAIFICPMQEFDCNI